MEERETRWGQREGSERRRRETEIEIEGRRGRERKHERDWR